MAILGRDQIFDADDKTYKTIPVPEWGGEVRIKTMTGTERDAFEASLQTQRGNGKVKSNMANFRARLLSLVIVDEDGTRLFADADVKRLGNKSVAALQRVFNAAQELNGLSDEDVEELTEDFEPEADEASTSD